MNNNTKCIRTYRYTVHRRNIKYIGNTKPYTKYIIVIIYFKFALSDPNIFHRLFYHREQSENYI